MIDKGKIATLGGVQASIDEYDLLRNNPHGASLTYDGATGEYDVAAFYSAQATPDIYGVKVPKGTYTTASECTKVMANAGLVIEPSTLVTAGRDDYAQLAAFKWYDTNATVDDSGVPHVSAIDGHDPRFARDGSNGNVWVMVAPWYYKVVETTTHHEIYYSLTKHDGYKPAPGLELPDGTLRPCMLYAKYIAGAYAGKLASVSGLPAETSGTSHNGMITTAHAVGAGYSGLTTADDFYHKIMLLLKYAHRNSQRAYAGCVVYDAQYVVASAETGVKRVLLSEAQAKYIVIGSCVSVGIKATSAIVDRDNTAAHSIANRVLVKSLVKVGTNWALNLDCSTMDVPANACVTTMPWRSGSCDNLMGSDGSPTSAASSKESYRVQGIELACGTYETVCNVIVSSELNTDGTAHSFPYTCYDSSNYAISKTANYVRQQIDLYLGTNGVWNYISDAVFNGYALPIVGGGTSTTHYGDGVYSTALTSQGDRELLVRGGLADGSHSGLWCQNVGLTLADAYWGIGGRLSALGRTKPQA